MTDLVPKKERHLGYWLQAIALIVSIFAAIMAYYAFVSSSEVSLKLTKSNELETRNYENKTILYNYIIGVLNNVETGSGNYQDFKTAVSENKMELEIYGSNNINQLLACIDNGYKLLINKKQIITSYNKEDEGRDYQRRILLPVFLLKKEIRAELNNYDKYLYKFENDGLMREFNSSLTDISDLENLVNGCYDGGVSKIIKIRIQNKTGTGGKTIILSPK